MAVFKNLVTGNILVAEHPDTVKLMQGSERYAEVAEVERKPEAKRPATKPEK